MTNEDRRLARRDTDEVKKFVGSRCRVKWNSGHPMNIENYAHYQLNRCEQRAIFTLRTGYKRLRYNLVKKLTIGQTYKWIAKSMAKHLLKIAQYIQNREHYFPRHQFQLSINSTERSTTSSGLLLPLILAPKLVVY